MSFDAITELQTGHFGILWQKFRPNFSETEDHNLIGTVSEENLNNRGTYPLPRVWFVHKGNNEVIQVQRNCFLHNWRKRRPDDEYPGYETVLENFQKYLSHFQEFLTDEKLGNLIPNQYEITYVNHILENEGWETINNLEKIFPNLVSLKDRIILSTDMREINWQTVFGLPDDYGRLQLSIRNARRLSDNRHLLRIDFTAQSNEPYEPMRDWFDSAHKVILELFTSLISEEIQEKFWGKSYARRKEYIYYRRKLGVQSSSYEGAKHRIIFIRRRRRRFRILSVFHVGEIHAYYSRNLYAG